MWRDFIAELGRTMDEILRSVARFLPRFLEMLAIVVAGLVIALVLKYLLGSLLRITRIAKMSENTGAANLLRGAALPSLSERVSPFVVWPTRVLFILAGV